MAYGNKKKCDVIPELLTVNEAAAFLGISPITLRTLTEFEDIRVVNVAPKNSLRRMVRYSRTDLLRFIESRKEVT